MRAAQHMIAEADSTGPDSRIGQVFDLPDVLSSYRTHLERFIDEGHISTQSHHESNTLPLRPTATERSIWPDGHDSWPA